MKKYSRLVIYVLFCSFFAACNLQNEIEESGTITPKPTDIIPSKSVETNTVVLEEEVEKTPLEHHMQYLKETWKNTPNPIIAKYEGTDFGDYFHFSFIDKEGNGYDFADGNNDLGDYVLYDEDYEENKKYVGKEFEIKWDWKISEFTCCDGMMDRVKGEVPSIVTLQLKE